MSTKKITYRLFNIIIILSILVVLLISFKLNGVTAQTTVDTITLGTSVDDTNLTNVAVNPITNRLYIADFTKKEIFVIDGDKNSLIKTVKLEITPTALSINYITNIIYVLEFVSPFGGGDSRTTIEIIDGDTNEISSSIQIESRIAAIAVNSTTNFIYACSTDGIIVIDGETNKTVDTIKTEEKRIQQLVINEKTNRLYGARFGLEWLSVLLTGGEPFDFRLQIGITVIDLDRNRVIDVIPRLPGTIALNPETNLIYVTRPFIFRPNPLSGDIIFCDKRELRVIDGDNNKVINTIDDSGLACPGNLAVNPTTNRIYLRNSDTFLRPEEILTVIDGNTNNVIRTFILEDSHKSSIGINPVTNRIYILNDLSVTVMQDDGEQRNEDTFTIECNNGFASEGLNNQYLTLEVNETAECVLKLLHAEAGTPVKLSTFLGKDFNSSVTLEQIDKATDIYGEAKFNITALEQGIDLLGWRMIYNNKDVKSKNKIINFGMSIEVE